MATTTTNFGWDIPQSTDLVKDGATAIAALGQDIDTALVDLKGGTTGQVLAKASNTDLDYTWTTPEIGDITAVTAGTGISGGGTTGAVTITNSMATAIDAKGDLIAGTGADAFSRLAVGANGTILVADSTAATGLKWASTGNFVGCRVLSTTAQSVANSTDTAAAFAVESYDTNAFHDNVTNNNRLTIPAGLSGYYRITANIGFATSATGRRIIQIRLNGGASLCAGEMTPATGVEPTGILTVTSFLSAGDYVDLLLFQNSGASLNTSGNGTRDYFEIQRVGS